ncbi:MAG: hypothetical protein MSG64_16805 [Pyrinomonadaceae bacterium MAG19_C2-C3]|nr:hypothetical protein [Pyrinomonadaceae bacterium MAG19_C2-C3]
MEEITKFEKAAIPPPLQAVVRRRSCPNCNSHLVYEDDRDDEGNIENAYYRCPDDCGYAEGV